MSRAKVAFPRSMIVASYNIQRGRGLDFVRRIDRAVEVLRAIEADVIGLQEIVVELDVRPQIVPPITSRSSRSSEL